MGHSAVVKEVMRRANMSRHSDKKISLNSYISSGFVGKREASVPTTQAALGKNEWVSVRQSKKSQKELSALHLCQEFQAHEGCVWTIKFSLDGRYLASAGEDKVIHVWEVQECEVMSLKPEEGNLTSRSVFRKCVSRVLH